MMKCFLGVLPVSVLALGLIGFWGERGFSQQARSSTVRKAGVVGDGHTFRMKRVSQDGDLGYNAIPQFGIPAAPQRHVTIVSMLIPVDWTFKAAQEQPKQMDCNLTTGRLLLAALSPDQKSAFISKPVPDTVWSNNRGVLQSIDSDNRQFGQNAHCVVEQARPLAERLPEMGRTELKGATVAGSLEPIPGLSGKLEQMVSQANANLARQGGQLPTRITAEAGRMRFTSHDVSGDGEGYLYGMQVVRTAQLPGGGVVSSVSMPLYFFTGAPLGQLAAMEPLFTAMAGSIQIDPDYQAESMQVSANIMHIHQVTKQRLAQIQSEIQADNARTAANIANIQAGAQQYRSQVMSNVAANRSAALEHSSQQFSLYMGDQAQYRDSSGRNVILPSGADHVWASSTGNTNEYILTDSASYNPNGQVGSGSWSQMQVQK